MLASIRRTLLSYIACETSDNLIIRWQRLCGIVTNGKASYQITNYPVHYFFKLASTTGEEMFGLMPLLFWIDPSLASIFSLNFGVILTAGQLCKDIMKLPRPANKDIAKLEAVFETEFGLPSTHTMSGMLPMCLLMKLIAESEAESIARNYLVSWWPWMVLLSVLIALSRLYLGVHSPVDILAGFLLGGSLLKLLGSIGNDLEWLLYGNVLGIACSTIILATFVHCYPRTKPWSASFGTATQIFGTWMGCTTSLWFVNQCSPQTKAALLAMGPKAEELRLPASASIGQWVNIFPALTHFCAGKLFLRFLGSLLFVGVTKIVAKKLSMILFLYLHRRSSSSSSSNNNNCVVDPLELVDVHGRAVPEEKLYWVEVPVRLVNYAAMAWATVVFAPLLCRYCKLSDSDPWP